MSALFTDLGLTRERRNFTISLLGVPIGASGSPSDRGSVSLPAGVTRWSVNKVTFRAATAAGTLALATVGVFTQAAGAGTTVVAAALLTSLTAANKIQGMTVAALTDAITDLSVFVRQTVNSGNSGTVDVVIECTDLT